MFSAEESSPVAYVTESCCVCDEEFSSDSELSNHLLDHANDEEFKASLSAVEQNNSSNGTVSNARPTGPEFRKVNMVKNEPMRNNFTQRSTSPEVWEIVSDDSDDDQSKHKNKVPRLSNSFRLVSAPSRAQTNSQTNSQTTPQAKSQPTVQATPQANPQTNLQTNQPTENGPPFHCRTCLSVFNDAKLFKDHLLTHEKPRPYACQICNKTFAYKGTLRQHLHLHIGEKSHECKTCHKKFSIKSVLRKHEEMHDMQLVRERMNNSQVNSSQVQI